MPATPPRACTSPSAASPPSKLTGKGADWYSAYKVRFNVEPEAYAAYGYEAIKVALDAIKRAGRKDRIRHPRGRLRDEGLRRRPRQLVVRRATATPR